MVAAQPVPLLPKMVSRLAPHIHAGDTGSVCKTVAEVADFVPGVALPSVVAGRRTPRCSWQNLKAPGTLTKRMLSLPSCKSMDRSAASFTDFPPGRS